MDYFTRYEYQDVVRQKLWTAVQAALSCSRKRSGHFWTHGKSLTISAFV